VTEACHASQGKRPPLPPPLTIEESGACFIVRVTGTTRRKSVTRDATGAARAKKYRTRRRRGMRCFMVRLDDAEIESLVKAGYLEAPITGPTVVQIAIEAFISDKLGEL
jgi:hypothetical protein